MNIKNTPCFVCMKIGTTQLISEDKSVFVRGQDFTVKEWYRKCSNCGYESSSSIDPDYLEESYNQYRKQHNMVTVSDIEAWCKKHNLTKEKASELLLAPVSTMDGRLQSAYDESLLLPIKLGVDPFIMIGDELLHYDSSQSIGGITPEIKIKYVFGYDQYQRYPKTSCDHETILIDTYLKTETAYFHYKRYVAQINNPSYSETFPSVSLSAKYDGYHRDKASVYNENPKLLSNPRGPASIIWDCFGRKREEIYYIKGIQHRIDGPSYVAWEKDGRVAGYGFQKNGELFTSRAQEIMKDWDLPFDFNWTDDQRLKFKLSF